MVATWAPETTEVELTGGPEDGQRITFRGAPDQPLVVTIGEEGQKVLYECIGWREDDRVWIYGPTT